MSRRLASHILGAACLLFTAFAALGQTLEPLRVFESTCGRVIVDAGKRLVLLNGQPLPEATGVVGAVEFGKHLLVAQRDGVVLIYDVSDRDEAGLPRFVQRFEQLGRDVQDIVAVDETGRVLLLASGSTEILGIKFHEQKLLDEGEVSEPAYVDHARFLEFLRDNDGEMDVPRLFALGPQSLALVTDREIIELFHFNRTYRILSRVAIPESIARVVDLVHTGSAWILTGLDNKAEPAVLTAKTTAGPWVDIGVAVLDAALEMDGVPIAWLPSRFTLEGPNIVLSIRGERGAVARWPASSDRLVGQDLQVEYIDER